MTTDDAGTADDAGTCHDAGTADDPAFRVERVPAEVTRPLRLRVLRAGQPPESVRFPVDDLRDTATFAARDGEGNVVGTALAYPVACPWLPDLVGWRLRAMATAPEVRSRGIGSRVLARVVAHVVGEGGEVLWCHARIPALEFYERAGFVTHGEPWEDPRIGPHIAMWRDLRAGGGPASA